MIKSVVVFETKGKQFPTIEKAIEHRENLIEEFIRKLPGVDTMAPHARILFVEAVIAHRNALIDLFNYNEAAQEEWED